MAVYNGSIELISGITQKNGGDFALVNAPAVQVDDSGKRLDVRLQELADLIVEAQSASNYENASNKPKINGIELVGDKSLTDLGVLDTTLKETGKAADAKAVGDAIDSLNGEVVKNVSIGGVAQTVTNNGVDLPAYPTKSSLGLDKLENTADADKVVASAGKFTTARVITVAGDATGNVSFDGSADVELAIEVKDDSHSHSDATITSLDASKLTGTIDIARLPKGALERCVVVANDTARFALTEEEVQLGDTVKVSETGIMYFVKDASKLASEDGYEVYTAGSATSVPWSGVTNKPETFIPSAHTHSIAEVNELQTALNALAKASDFNTHVGDTTVHITADERTNWNGAYDHSQAEHARVDATKTEQSATNGNVKINGAEVVVYKHATHTAKANGLYKVTVDAEGHVSETVAVTKEDITGLGVAGEDTGVTTVVANNGLTQAINDRELTLGIESISTDLLTQGANTLIINGGRPTA